MAVTVGLTALAQPAIARPAPENPQRTERQADLERAWATHPDTVAAAAYARRGEAPYVVWSRVSVISGETLGGHWYVNIVDA